MDRMDVIPKMTILSSLSLLFLIGGFLYMIRKRRFRVEVSPPQKMEEIKSEVSRCIESMVPIEGISEGTCPICLDGFQSADDARRLHCDHCFHGSCLVAWGFHCALKHQRRKRWMSVVQCPLCRQDHRFQSKISTAGPTRGPAAVLAANDATEDPAEFCV
eukprot:s2242_g2.t1